MAKRPQTVPLTEAEIKAPVTGRTFYRKAIYFIQITRPGSDLPTIRPGSEFWNLWREYFERHLQWVPEIMQRLIERGANAPLWMTVPCEDPAQFDARFIHDLSWRPSNTRYTMSDRDYHATLADLRAQFGPTWGLKDMRVATRRKTAWQSPTDDDLRKAYPQRNGNHTE